MNKKTKKKSATEKRITVSMPSGMKKTMSELVEAIGGGEVTEVELNALLSSLRGPSAYDRLSDRQADAKNEAQQIAFDAMEAENERQARKLAKRALRLDPDCVDALLVMTGLDARNPRETIEGLQKAVAAGERSLGEKFIRENKGHFWMLIETRPWMRAMAQLAELLRGQGSRADASGIYERMLELNPNDNQGVCDPLVGLYLETGDLNGAARLLNRYKEERFANHTWARVLERFLAADRAGAQGALKKARQANRHVEHYLTGQRTQPKEMPEMYSPGSEEEAVLCMSNLRGAWAEHKEATLWLYEQLAADGAGLSIPRNQ